jgi:uncharacterized protein (DUF2235 family)
MTEIMEVTTATPPTARLIACFDGTWNNDRSNTNVSRLFRKIADETCQCAEQRRFYDEGVGTKWGERLRGGVFGIGLDRNIRQGLAWLGSQFIVPAAPQLDADKFVVGPDIFLFGFSRGAFTARSLGGIINYLGLPKITLSGTDPYKGPLCDHPMVMSAWHLYADRPTPEERSAVVAKKASDALLRKIAQHDADADKFRATMSVFPVRIHCLCVWDTVGALGVPKVFDYAWIPRFSSKYEFHDTRLGGCVTNAYHAVAIDEQREPYCVTLWTEAKPTTKDVEQRWFPGAHADVGGGYDDDLLPDAPLAWLAEKAAAKGLCFVNDRNVADAAGVVKPYITQRPAAFDLDGREYLSPVHDSYSEFMKGTYKILRSLPGAGGRAYRRMLVLQDGIAQSVDVTATKKLDADPNYRPPNFAEAGRVDVNYHVAVIS